LYLEVLLGSSSAPHPRKNINIVSKQSSAGPAPGSNSPQDDAGEASNIAMPRSAPVTLLGVAAADCGGGGTAASGTGTATGDASLAPVPAPAPVAAPAPAPVPAPLPAPTSPPSAVTAPTLAQAARFLSQATFGATLGESMALTQSSYGAWIDEQIGLPSTTHLGNVDTWLAAKPANVNDRRLGTTYSLWKVFASAPDQLRQRMAFALSEIFVLSLVPSFAFNEPRMAPGYLDVLTINALGNYRKLLEDVSLSPAMGVYLSHLKNRPEDPVTGRVPDENYAREVLQLFSIGLNQLNADGSLQLDAEGNPIPTYTNADITGLARVFTGWSWAGPDNSSTRFALPLSSKQQAANYAVLPMQPYPQFHATSEKRFLGVTIAAQNSTDPAASLRIALDTIFNHPNTAPFIGKQLIQRLVSSNPSPAYVARVAAAFTDNGRGVRGDLAAVARAVLLDDEARQDDAAGNTSGKLREPVVRLLNWMRAFGAASASGTYVIDHTENPATELGQSPLYSASVFNFFRPGYRPPNSRTSAAALLSPEMQITTETTVAGYLNFIRKAIDTGAGRNNDVKASYADQLPLAADAGALVDHVNLLLAGSRMGSARQALIRDEVANIDAGTDAGKLNRVKLAAFLVMASPEYILQN
jgi:uncharacterized protein (DUF1800 family)